MQQRVRIDELMDDPALDARAHDHALAGLARLNAWSGSRRLLWNGIAAHAREARACGRTLTVIDVACGSGDGPIEMAERARRERLPIRWILCDLSAHALGVATERARGRGLEVETIVADVVARPLQTMGDVVTCSLFIHHCEPDAAVAAMRHMRDAARIGVGITDLDRTRRGLALAWLGSRALSRSPVVHFDATASVRAAFTRSEAAELAQAAGLDGARIEPAFPERWRLWWRRPA
ncbi:MAG: hypothetical protein RIS45_838 [Planctomycetota bacterium]